jgi:hypothetical protein
VTEGGQARTRMDTAKTRIEAALQAHPEDLYALGAEARACDASLAAALGYTSVLQMFVAELPGVDAENLVRASFYVRLIEEGGYAKPSGGAGALSLEVPGAPGKPTQTLPFKRCSLEQLAQALALATGKPEPDPRGSAPPQPAPPQPAPPQPSPRHQPEPSAGVPFFTRGRMGVALGIGTFVATVLVLHQCHGEPAPTSSAPAAAPQPAPPVMPPPAVPPHPPRPTPARAAAPVNRAAPAEAFPIKTVTPSGNPVPQADDPDLQKMIKERDREQSRGSQ